MKNKAFTLLEMLVAITVFTIFIGLVMSSYISFHHAQQDAAAKRSLLLESERILAQITQLVQENRFYYGDEEEEGIFDFDLLPQVSEATSLQVINADGVLQTLEWNPDEETLTLQIDDDEPMLLHGDNTMAKTVSFRLFPAVNPYAFEYARDLELQYQPNVQIKMTFATLGRYAEEVTVDFQTSITSRFYQ